MYTFKQFMMDALAASITLILLAPQARSQQITKGVKNIVLVYGAFADGSSWARIIPLLQAKGYNVVAVQNPLTSLEDDVAAAKRAIASMDGPVLLVGQPGVQAGCGGFSHHLFQRNQCSFRPGPDCTEQAGTFRHTGPVGSEGYYG